MITPKLIEEFLQDLGTSRKAAWDVSKGYHTLKRNRAGAHVGFIPASLSGLDTDIFLKKYDCDEQFLRESGAIKLLAKKSCNKANILLAPKLVYLNKSRKLIATEAIQGIPLSEMLKGALRLDKAIFRRGYSLSSTLDCLVELIECMRVIHITPVEFPHGYDHTPLAILKRIRAKIDSLVMIKELGRLSALVDVYLKGLENFVGISLTKQEKLIYVHGDLCPSNIIIENSRPHLIDFEDSGYGVPGRDLAYFIHLLRPLENNRFYLSGRVNSMIRNLTELHNSLFDVPKWLTEMWEIEWYLDEIGLLLKGEKTKMLSRHTIERIKKCTLSMKKILCQETSSY